MDTALFTNPALPRRHGRILHSVADHSLAIFPALFFIVERKPLAISRLHKTPPKMYRFRQNRIGSENSGSRRGAEGAEKGQLSFIHTTASQSVAIGCIGGFSFHLCALRGSAREKSTGKVGVWRKNRRPIENMLNFLCCSPTKLW
jgi:hypothetical protein